VLISLLFHCVAAFSAIDSQPKRKQDVTTTSTFSKKMESDGDSKQGLVDALRKAAGGNNRSKTARLREIFDEVEEAKASGLHLKTIVSILATRGLEFDLGTFVNIRHRIKNERKKRNKTVAANPPNTSVGLKTNHPTQTTTESQVKPKRMNNSGTPSPEKLTGIINGQFDLNKYRNKD
jgi:hypothetical protein